MRDSLPSVRSSEASPQKESSVSSTMGDATTPSNADPQFLRAQKLMSLVSLAPSSFSSQEKVNAAIAIYEAATRFEHTRDSREAETEEDEEIIQRQLDLMTGDFRQMKEETTCRLLSLDSKLDRVLGALEENAEKAEEKTRATDPDTQQASAQIEEVHVEVAKLVEQIKNLATLINKMGGKVDKLVPPSQARPTPCFVPLEQSRQTRPTQRSFSPSPVYCSGYLGEEGMNDDWEARTESSDESLLQSSTPRGMKDATLSISTLAQQDINLMAVPFSSQDRSNGSTAARPYIQASPRDAPARRSKAFRDDVQVDEAVDMDDDYWEWEDAFPILKNRKRSGKTGKRAKKGFVPKSAEVNWRAGEVKQNSAVGAVGTQKPLQPERRFIKKERKRLAKLEAEKKRQEDGKREEKRTGGPGEGERDLHRSSPTPSGLAGQDRAQGSATEPGVPGHKLASLGSLDLVQARLRSVIGGDSKPQVAGLGGPPEEEADSNSNPKRRETETENYYDTNTEVLELSKQIEMITKEIKDLRGEVQELHSAKNIRKLATVSSRHRSTTGSGLLEPPNHTPNQIDQTSGSHTLKTATATCPRFIMKDGELSFHEGEIITLLDAPTDTPHGWLYGEVNVAKRGLFPASYVELQK
ncbi:hypothetical protein FRC01_004286 [Tulasnella sp. 417]|nr:hypothetical protein FRC01_004286 [Tulasnella sp. 417]